MLNRNQKDRDKQRLYWREEMKAAERKMYQYPAGSDEREVYLAKYKEAADQYFKIAEEVVSNGRNVNP